VRSSRGHVDVASVTSDEGRDPKRKRSRSTGGEDQLKKRLWLLYRTVLDYQVGSEISYRTVFDYQVGPRLVTEWFLTKSINQSINQ